MNPIVIPLSVFVALVAPAPGALPDGAPTAPPASEDTVDDFVEAPDLAPLEGAELPPLPAGVYVRFQLINMGEFPYGNFRFQLFHDGQCFYVKNGNTDLDPPRRYDRPYPPAPTKTLSRRDLEKVHKLVRAKEFEALAAGYRLKRGIEDGAMKILEVSAAPGLYKRVIIGGGDHPVVDRIAHEILALVRK